MLRLRSWLKPRRNALAHPPAARVRLEELEVRALPSTFGNLLSALHQAADIRSDVTDAGTDVQALVKAVGPSATGSVTKDLNALQADLTTLSNDFAAGKDLTQDVKQ